MPKLVDEVLLLKLQELGFPVGTPSASDLLYFGFSDGDAGYKIAISTLAQIISTELGSAANIPDRYYFPFDTMPSGASIGNGSDFGFTGTNNVIIDPYLDGKEYSVFRRGLEYGFKGVNWQNDIPGGGIRLVVFGDEFTLGDQIAVQFKTQISPVIVTPDAVGRFTNGEQEVNASVSAGPSYDRKLIILNGSTAAAITYTLNPNYPENVICPIKTVRGGTMKQAIIMAPGGQQLWDGTNLSRIVLGEADHCLLIRVGNNWRVLSRGDRWQRVGSSNWGGFEGPNQIWAQGQTVLETTIPSLADYLDYVASLPSYNGSILTPGAWALSNKTQWGRGGGSIYVPDRRGWFARSLDRGAGKDAARVTSGDGFKIGSSQGSANLAHNHDNPDGNFNQLMRKTGTFTNGGATDNTPGEPNIISSGTILDSGGPEARPENYGDTLTFWI